MGSLMNIKTTEDYNEGLDRLECLTHGVIDEAYKDEIGDLLSKLNKFENENPDLIPPISSVEDVEKLFYHAINKHLACQ